MTSHDSPVRRRLSHPAAVLGLGLAAVPVAKLLWIPNYVFNFLTTLVHECGHALFAWLVGRPSIPTISVAGGGVTMWQDQVLVLALAVWAVPIFFAWRARANRVALGVFAGLAILYPLLAFTPLNELLPIAGGVLLEVGGATACFVTAIAVPLERPFERPLYALWGWWMIVNRGAESVLMLRDRAAWESSRIIGSGLAAGLESDLHRVSDALRWAPRTVLGLVLVLCLLSLPAAAGIAWWMRRRVS